eukprot:jgi/Hompol1/5278/HPOL_004301-RA
MLGFLWHLSNPWSALIVALVSMVIITYFKYVPADNQPLGNLGDIQGQTPFHEKKWISNFAKLPFGKTHYFLLGPEDGQKVVFVHGISCPGQCLPSFFNQLAAKGYRVLVYDHFGRGFSDSPGVFYSQDFYVSQLAMLLLSLGWTKTSIIGYSLGGAITAHFVAKFPHVIENVIFIAPTGLMTVGQRCSICPLFFFVFGRGVLKKISESNQTLKPTENEDLVEFESIGADTHLCIYAHMIRLNSYMIQNHPGYLRAYFSTVIHFKFGGNDDTY